MCTNGKRAVDWLDTCRPCVIFYVVKLNLDVFFIDICGNNH